VNRAQSERVGERILIERTIKFVLRREPDKLQAIEQLEKKMDRAFDRAAAANADKVLDDHRLIPRRRPQDRSAQVRKLGEHLHEAGRFYRCHDGVGQSRKGMIGGPQQHAAQSDAITRYRERYDLSSPVGKQLETAGPSLLKDKGGLAELALMHQFLAAR
jgi:hypothetical protein